MYLLTSLKEPLKSLYIFDGKKSETNFAISMSGNIKFNISNVNLKKYFRNIHLDCLGKVKSQNFEIQPLNILSFKEFYDIYWALSSIQSLFGPR